jgi:UDP-glucuronate 4-epimerase
MTFLALLKQKMRFPHVESMPSMLPVLDDDSSANERITNKVLCGDYCQDITLSRPNAHRFVSCADLRTMASSDSSTSDDDESSSPTTNTANSSNGFFGLVSSPERKALAIKPHTMKKKVLVTGGAGFVGSSVAMALLARGDDVVIVDEMNDYYDVRIKENNLCRLSEMVANDDDVQESQSRRLTIYRGDICDEEFMLHVFETERPKWVCHMAARAGVRPSIQDPYIYIHSNIRGTTHLMELSHKFGIENFVFASSSSVYGGSKSTFFNEDEVVDNPVSPYAASKKACELLAYTYHHLYQLNVTGLRFFTVYGPRGRPDMAPFKFIDRLSRGLELQQFGDGSSSRDYTYIDDIVDGILRAVDRPYPYQVFNLGKGSGTSLKEFIEIVEKHVGQTAIIKILPDQLGDVPYTCADVSKAYDLLGYTATISFDEGIRRTVHWYDVEYVKNIKCIEPETQANGMGRAASFVEIRQVVRSTLLEASPSFWVGRT